MTSARAVHPILHLEVLSADGTSQDEHRVFCRLRHRSVRVDDCCECPHCDSITGGASPAVNCTIPAAPTTPENDPGGERLEVGALLCTGTVVIAQSASVDSALRVLRTESRRAVAIVDEHHVLVGLVHETGFMGRRELARESTLGGIMSTAVAVNEHTPVRTALRLLAKNHLREATVVADDGVPIGVFRDIDGLRWIGLGRAVARRAPTTSSRA